MKYISIIVTILLFNSSIFAQMRKTKDSNPVVIETNLKGTGIEFEIEFLEGPEIYYPLLAIWLEDTNGNYIQTLYVAQSIAKGVFNFGKAEKDHWISAPKRQPAALPYWGHKRGIQAPDGFYLPTPENPIADAYTGATPIGDFILSSKADSFLPEQFNILMEINQSWDWNKYWTNNKFPDNKYYKTSAQPALVYCVKIDQNKDQKEYEMKAIGHSHYSGKDGNLYKDLSTLTTALEIVDKIIVSIKK